MQFDNLKFKNEEEVEFFPMMSLETNFNEDEIKNIIKDEIGILPLKNTVLFPGVILPISISREKSMKLIEEANAGNKYIGVVSQKQIDTEDITEKDLLLKGSIAKIIKVMKMPDNTITVIIQGKSRFEIKTITTTSPYFKAKVELLKDSGNIKTDKFKAIVDSIKDVAIKIINISPSIPSQSALLIRNIDDPAFLIHFIAGNIGNTIHEKQQILELDNIQERASLLLTLLNKEMQFVELKNKVANKTKTELDKQQKDYFLQQQIKSLKDELAGGDSNDKDLKEMKKKAELKKWDKNVKETFNKGIEKLERMHNMSPDYSVAYNHLELLLELPWGEYTNNEFEIKKARKSLNNSHFGLDKIKERIIEYLAVLKLKGDMKSPILCFVGPPGIGKTSLGKSIAEAIGRKFIKISLGGLYDEAEIRGHRKTYIGAMPGRIIQALKKCKTSNPVILLDEIDKVGRDHRGDVSSALLEVLDPEQNANFYDNYLELDYDLSKILFITTANELQNIQAPLRDRLEIINLSGYAIEEKIEIAKTHLIDKQKVSHGLAKVDFSILENSIQFIVENYTRESGVRELERHISSIMRNIALNYISNEKIPSKIEPNNIEKILGKPKFTNDKYTKNLQEGVSIGLAWTSVGGEILFIESTMYEGKGELVLTGNLGNVMKESASIAYTYLKSHYQQFGISKQIFETKTIHLHFPEGATPKDGPSAGIAILSCLTSLLVNKKIKSFLAMTGEITLRGQVLPVGGIKEKVLAAKRSGIKEIILCNENEKDILEIDQRFLKGLKFHFVEKMPEVLKITLNI